jgi:chromosome segregation ATPase
MTDLLANPSAARDRNFSDMSSSNIGDDRGEMQSFVHRHLLSLLQPLTDHVRELTAQVNTMRGDLLDNVVRIDKKLAVFDGHDRRMSDLTADVAQANVKVGKMHTELSKETERVARSSRERTESAGAKTDAHLQDMALRLAELQKACGPIDLALPKLERRVTEVAEFAANMCNDISTIKVSFEGMHHEHLGLSQRLELTKQLASDSASSLSEATYSLGRQQMEAKKHREELHGLVQENVDSIRELNQAQKTQIGRLEAAEAVTKAVQHGFNELKSSMGMMEETLNSAGENDDEERDAEVEKIRAGVGTMIERMERLEGTVATVRVSHTELSDRVAVIDTVAATETQRLSDTASLARDTTELQQILAAQVHDAQRRICSQEAGQEKLVERADLADADVRCMDATQKETLRTVAADKLEIDKTIARVQGNERALIDTNANLSHLATELGVAKEVVAKLVPRLELAHEYLQGVGKGFQEAHQCIAEGKDGMFRPKKKIQATLLPGLPGSFAAGVVHPIDRPKTV